MTDLELIDAAKEASRQSYSPYSKFKVGAALLREDGSLYKGCNVENASYGATCCAERTALFTAVADGKRRFSKLAVAGSSDGTFAIITQPCGVCLQALSEFCSGEFEVLLTDKIGIRKMKLSDYLPYPFEKASMEG